MKIAIDPGHGGDDPGALGPGGSREADINLAISLKVADLLVAVGHEVIVTRDGDVGLADGNYDPTAELWARCQAANTAKAALFISVHCNAADNAGARGVETWFFASGAGLAAAVQARLGALGLADRGVKQGNLYVLKHTDMPAILVEVAFISNHDEERRLTDEAFQASVSQAIAEGILEYVMRGE